MFCWSAEFPERNPTIEDVKQYYSIGENLEANCTSNSSIPPAKLEWWINDLPIYSEEHTIRFSTIVDPLTNRETSRLGLRLPLTNEHFFRGRVKVSISCGTKSTCQGVKTCVATENPITLSNVAGSAFPLYLCNGNSF